MHLFCYEIFELQVKMKIIFAFGTAFCKDIWVNNKVKRQSAKLKLKKTLWIWPKKENEIGTKSSTKQIVDISKFCFNPQNKYENISYFQEKNEWIRLGKMAKNSNSINLNQNWVQNTANNLKVIQCIILHIV